MLEHLRPAIAFFVALTILTGVLYPGVVTVIAQAVFPHQANGSLLQQNEQVVGSELIGQQFTNPKFFWGRISATSPTPYNAAASSGSNLGPMNATLIQGVRARIEALQDYDSVESPIPVDLVTASASGLDPHITPAAAEYQIPRIAKNRSANEEKIRELVRKYTEQRQFGLFGEPRVNVLLLNLALDQPQSPQ